MKKLVLSLALFTAITPACAADLRLGWTTPEQRAALVFAMSAYVEDRCPGLKNDDLATLRAIEAQGLSVADVTAEMGPTLQLWLQRLRRGGLQSCMDVFEAFGPEGTLQPGLVATKN
jgi:hypothetical protein